MMVTIETPPPPRGGGVGLLVCCLILLTSFHHAVSDDGEDLSHTQLAVRRLRSLVVQQLAASNSVQQKASGKRHEGIGRRLQLTYDIQPYAYNYKWVPQCLWRPPATEDEAGTCYLHPGYLVTEGTPGAESAIENMLLKAAFVAYQCHTITGYGQGDCGGWGDPIDCEWVEAQERCAVPQRYLFKRLLTYLHCRDDASIAPYWDRCYVLGKTRSDQECNAANSDDYKCMYYFDLDVCAPDPREGGASREQYDEIVASIRSGVWQQEWFGECPTAEIVYTAKSACNFTTEETCTGDCEWDANLPIEYGACSLKKEVLANTIFAEASDLFSAVAAAMEECGNAAGTSLAECEVAGQGPARVDYDKTGQVADLVYIEELGSAGGARPLLALVATLLLAAVLLLLRW